MTRKYEQWNTQDWRYIMEHYEHESVEEMAKAIGRSYWSVRGIMRRMGVIKKDAWTAAEIDYLKRMYSTLPVKAIASNLRRHSICSIYSKARELNLRRKGGRDED